MDAIAQGRRSRRSQATSRVSNHTPFSITNALVVFPNRVERSDIVVRDGVIHRVGALHTAKARRIDCGGDYLLPGLIELHTDNLERHIEPRPRTFWNTDLAVVAHDAELASAGITTVCEAITIGGDIGERAREGAYLDAIASMTWAESQGVCRADHYLHLRCELGSPRLIEHLHEATKQCVPKLISLMEHVPGHGQWSDVGRFREHYASRYGLDAKALDELIARRQQHRGRFSAENRAAVARIASEFGCMLASHDDAVVADVDRAQQVGCRLSEFPTSLEAARAARQRGMQVIAGAPNLVRGGSHSGNVAAADLATAGLIDIVSSDYCPSSLLQAVFRFAQLAGIGLNEAVATATENPARALNLQDRGQIVEGKRADLVRVRETTRGPVVVAAWAAGRQIA